jgi:glycosyltransferase involved in cell wall biosynthesis
VATLHFDQTVQLIRLMCLRFSIVIPTLNRKEMLRHALDSIKSQNWPNLEIIIVDGGSGDGTIEEIEKRNEIILLKGPDRGVYDALNKGFGRASGDVIGALNSDDSYTAGAFEAIADCFTRHPEAHAVCGTASLVENGDVIAVYDREEDKALTARTALIGSSIINARMFRQTAINEIGPFDLAYRCCADRDWLVRWHEAGLRTLTIPRYVYCYRRHQGSLTFSNDRNRQLVVNAEMLMLARRWRNDHSASLETRRIAMLLEGRCIGKLAGAAARRGDLTGSLRLLISEENHCSLTPALALARGGIDWVAQRSRAIGFAIAGKT